MKMFLAALFASSALAMPAGSFQCSGGLTNSSPMCCSTNVLNLVGLDCKTRTWPGRERDTVFTRRMLTCYSQRGRLPLWPQAQLLHSGRCKLNLHDETGWYES